MMDEKVLSVNPVPLVKVKEMLKEIAKEGELTYEQTLTLKYADKFSKITRAKAEKLIEDLMKIEGMTEEIAIKITDLLPQNEEILSLIISKKVKISDEDMKKIIKTVKDYYVSEEPKQAKAKK